MWPTSFDKRLKSWFELRNSVESQPLDLALININHWWFETPWQPYYLHWDDQATWPDPWQLLSDNIYCDVARGLGILYTITLLDRADLTSTSLVLTQTGHNLVLVDRLKYIMNWEAQSIVNTSHNVVVHQQLTQQQIQKKFNLTNEKK
jgi:hypothetical protein